MVFMVDGKPWYPFWTHQADATLNQANPVSGTQYAVLAATNYVRIITIGARVTWTVQPDPLQVWVTADGNVLEGSHANPVSATQYAFHNVNPILATWSLEAAVSAYRAFTLEGKTVAVAVETTGGTSNPLEARVKYARYI